MLFSHSIELARLKQKKEEEQSRRKSDVEEMCKLNNSQGNRQTNWIWKGPLTAMTGHFSLRQSKLQQFRSHNGAGSMDEWKLLGDLHNLCVYRSEGFYLRRKKDENIGDH